MSEKELRKASKKLWYACTTQSQTAVEAMLAIDKALATNPDVVVLLRWLKTNQQTEERYLSEKRRRSEHDTHYRQGARNAFRDTIVTIEQSFGIRLTADGYEWTEEKTP